MTLDPVTAPVCSPTEPTISIRIEGEFDLDVSDVFPDGVPDPLTIEAVVEAVQSARDVRGLINDWNLVPSVTASLYRGRGTPSTDVCRTVWR